MPKTEITYPEWVQKYRERGTTVKKKGDSYYLYKRTSKRVPDIERYLSCTYGQSGGSFTY